GRRRAPPRWRSPPISRGARAPVRQFSPASARQYPLRSSARGACIGRGGRTTHGLVVESVNVSVFAYCPVRSGSLAAIACWNCSDTESLLIGPAEVSRCNGRADTDVNVW